MASYTQLPQVDWLELLQENWINSEHFMLINEYEKPLSEMWLMCDPSLDPTEAQTLEELKLLFYRPLQVLPQHHFTATTKGDNLVLIYGNLSFEIIPSKNQPNIFYTYMDDGLKRELDLKHRQGDFFFHPLQYNDELLKRGDFVLYDEDAYTFAGWSGPNLQLLRRHRITGKIYTQTPPYTRCLRAERDVPHRTPKPKASSSQVNDRSDSTPSLLGDLSIPPTQRSIKHD